MSCRTSTIKLLWAVGADCLTALSSRRKMLTSGRINGSGKELVWRTNALDSAAINLYPAAVFSPHQYTDFETSWWNWNWIRVKLKSKCLTVLAAHLSQLCHIFEWFSTSWCCRRKSLLHTYLPIARVTLQEFTGQWRHNHKTFSQIQTC